jgi:hypothetical protein
MTYKAGCLICGAALSYSTDEHRLTCSICEKSVESSVECENGHYVCDSCHSLSTNEWIEQSCFIADEKDPVTLANRLMNNPMVRMHGPEHHFLVPAVLITVYYNILDQKNQKASALAKARHRAEKVLGGFCGHWGACGAAIGNGIFYSIITGSNPLSTTDWRFSNLLTSHTLKSIAEHGGPRCCKRDVYLSIIKAVEFINDKLKTSIPLTSGISCEYSYLNRECLTKGCPFYKS